MSQNKEPNNDKNNELMSKLSGIFGGGGDDKKDNNKKNENELKNYIDGNEGEEIKPINRRSEGNGTETRSGDCKDANDKTTMCRVLGWLSIAVGITSVVLGFIVSPYVFIASAVAVISLFINIGIVNSENKKNYLQKYTLPTSPQKCNEQDHSEQQYKNNEQQNNNLEEGRLKKKNNNIVNQDNANANGVENLLNEKQENKDKNDVNHFLAKKNKKIDDHEPNYTKQDENQAMQKENSI